MNTDGVSGTTAINIDAAKTMRYGGLTEQEALDLITINPARELGIAKHVGSIEVGKDADLVIWDGHPLSVYSHVDTTLIDGEVYFQRHDLWNVDAKSTFKTKLDPFTYVAIEPTLPKAKTYAIVGGTVHPVSGPVIKNGIVLMSNGLVTAVGTQVVLPRGTVTVDAKGMNVYLWAH